MISDVSYDNESVEIFPNKCNKIATFRETILDSKLLLTWAVPSLDSSAVGAGNKEAASGLNTTTATSSELFIFSCGGGSLDGSEHVDMI